MSQLYNNNNNINQQTDIVAGRVRAEIGDNRRAVSQLEDNLAGKSSLADITIPPALPLHSSAVLVAFLCGGGGGVEGAVTSGDIR